METRRSLLHSDRKYNRQGKTVCSFNSVLHAKAKLISIQSTYNNQKVEVEWLESSLPLQNRVDESLAVNSFSPVVAVPSDNMNGNNYDTSRVGMEYDLSGGTQGIL